MKKFLSLLTCLIFLVVVAIGCGSQSADKEITDNEVEKNETESSKKEDSSSDTSSKEIIVLKGFSPEPGKPDNWDTPVGKKLIEKTGVKIEFEYAVGDPSQKMSLMAASGDYPDILPTRGTDVFYQAGALLQLDELIDKYGPNIKKLYGDKLEMARWSEEDPHIYSFHWLKLNQRRFTPDGSPFAIQLDVLRELGYPEIKTLQQYENAIRTYKQNHTTIDGQPTIGLSLCGGDTLMFILSVTNPAFFATGAPDDGEWYIDPETGKPQLHITRPVEKEYFRWLNHMYAEGLLDEESFVQKKDQYVSKIASGRVLATINGVWTYADATKVLRREGKEWRTIGIVPVAMEGYENSNNWKKLG